MNAWRLNVGKLREAMADLPDDAQITVMHAEADVGIVSADVTRQIPWGSDDTHKVVWGLEIHLEEFGDDLSNMPDDVAIKVAEYEARRWEQIVRRLKEARR